MKPRWLAVLAIASTIFALTLNGAGQFGYAYFGLLGGTAALCKELIRISGWSTLAVVAPILAIAIMFLYVALILVTAFALVLRVFKKESGSGLDRKAALASFGLSIVTILGLTLAKVLPGDQQPPLEISLRYWVYPTVLLLLAILLKKEPNQSLQPTALLGRG